MDDRRLDKEQTPDLELERLLAESLSAPPPDDILTEITPWRQAMNRTLAGLALSSITLNFLWLDTILPTIGMVLLLLLVWLDVGSSALSNGIYAVYQWMAGLFF